MAECWVGVIVQISICKRYRIAENTQFKHQSYRVLPWLTKELDCSKAQDSSEKSYNIMFVRPEKNLILDVKLGDTPTDGQ